MIFKIFYFHQKFLQKISNLVNLIGIVKVRGKKVEKRKKIIKNVFS